MRDVAVIGVGITKFGELWDKSFRQLIAEQELRQLLIQELVVVKLMHFMLGQ